MSVFEVRSSDEEITPANDRFIKVDGYHVVPPPIIGNFLTPRADISFAGLDEYAIRKKIIETGLVNPVRPNGKRAVHTVSTARPISTARLISTARPVSTPRPFAPKIAQTGSAIRPIYPRMDNVRPRASYSPIKREVVNTGKGKMDNDLKKSRWVWRPKGNPEICLQDHAVVDSGCSSHMTGNKTYLSDYEDYNGGFVAFRSDPKGGKITGKGKSELLI
ncbi:hypothetical protein Tco_1444016 [Tanacetum coccineum]